MKVALIGNQNSGKTTLFNKLTGDNQKIGNWPGVTIEKKEGTLKKNNDIIITDLPGVYSLSPYTCEEQVSMNYLVNENPDLILNVVDSTNLERSLYLTTQLLEFGINVVLALNMTDLLKNKNMSIDIEKLETMLGVKAVQISAGKGEGIDELLKIICSKKTQNNLKKPKIFSDFIENQLNNIVKTENNRLKRFNILSYSSNNYEDTQVNRFITLLEKIYKNDYTQIIAGERYKFISSVIDECLIMPKQTESLTKKIDKIVLNRLLSIPIFILIMGLIYYLSVGVVGNLTSSFMSSASVVINHFFEKLLLKMSAPAWLVSLILDGVLTGVCSVLEFLPQIMVLSLFIVLLETCGYMSRISFIFDKVFSRLGLSGRSLIPFIVGTSCSVPAIMTCRTIECTNEKDMTAVLTPFIPCSAKLPIIALFAGYFFKDDVGLVTLSLYFVAVVVIILSSFLLGKLVFKVNNTSFVSELPEYKLPNAKYVFKDVWLKVLGFIKRAGSVILICSLVIWLLSSFNWGMQYGCSIDKSILSSIGNIFGWFFYPIVGEWNWAVSISAIQGLIAKEQVISSLSVISNLSGTTPGFASGIFSCFNPVSAYSFILFNLFSAPCFASIGAMRCEMSSKKKVYIAVLYQILIAWGISSLFHLVGDLIF